MNINDIISSGILETYVLGNANPEEIKKIQEWEKVYPLIKEEIEAIEESLMDCAEANTKSPSTHVKRKLMDELFDNHQNSKSSTTPKVVQLVPTIKVDDKPNIILYAVAASIVLLIGSSILNYVLYNKLNNAEAQLAELNSEKSVLANQFQTQQVLLNEKSNELALVMKPGSKMVVLKGLDISPSSAATIVWNTTDKSVYIDVASLPLAPQGKQYQLWALVDGKPVDAGVFNVSQGNQSIQKMKDMAFAQAFAVTLEKSGGSPSPTMEAMYLIGNI